MAKKLYRSRKDKMISGVCGGLADYFDTDVTIVRLLVIVVGLATAVFPLIIGYFICAIIIPEADINDQDEDDVEVYDKDGNKIYQGKQKKTKQLIGISLIILGSLLFLKDFVWWFDQQAFLGIAVVVIGVYILINGIGKKTN